jgi:hypothetical protein
MSVSYVVATHRSNLIGHGAYVDIIFLQPGLKEIPSIYSIKMICVTFYVRIICFLNNM